MKLNKKIFLMLIGILLLLVLTGCKNGTDTNAPTADNSISLTGEAISATVYKSPNCGCCQGWISDFEKNSGIKVNVIYEDNMNSIKDKYNVPANMRSCHTAIVNGYVIEGHIPFEAVEKLLSEKPDIEGIAMPGMPSGSAGMPGPKRGEFIIYELPSGKEFMRI